MNDRMSDLDALVDVAARAIYDFNRNRHPWEASHPTIRDHLTAEARAALLAVGLPALLERVEAAEGEVVRLGDLLADFYVLPSDEPIRRRLIEADVAIAERDALAAKVARVEALFETSDYAPIVDFEQLRTALDASEAP